ncbi:MAG: hypothetical protein M1839_005981 [Geoglossum umbratile]|nr:MAG: hypothetical protein M1839_005981 [Geoglossum umbratile]
MSWICCFPCMVCIKVQSRREKRMARRQQDLEASLSTSEPAADRGMANPRHWPAEMPYAPVHQQVEFQQVELLDSNIPFHDGYSVGLTPPRKGGILSGARRLLGKANVSRKIYARSDTFYSDTSQERGWEMLDGSKAQEDVYQEPVDEGLNSTLCGPPTEKLSLSTGSAAFTITGPSRDTKQEPGVGSYDSGAALDLGDWVTDCIKEDEDGGFEWQPDEVEEVPTTEPLGASNVSLQIPSTPGGVGNDRSYLQPMPSLSPSSVGESPSNSYYAQDTPRSIEGYSGSWHYDGLPRTTDAYLEPQWPAAPPQTTNPYPGYGPSGLPGPQLPEIPEVDMPDPMAFIIGPSSHQSTEIPDVVMPDVGYTPSMTDPTGISTDNSPSGGFSEPDQDGPPFECPTCKKTYERRCDLTYEFTKLPHPAPKSITSETDG